VALKNTPTKVDRGPTHDSNYKLLYSHVAMVSDLLQGFIPGAWINELGLVRSGNRYTVGCESYIRHSPR